MDNLKRKLNDMELSFRGTQNFDILNRRKNHKETLQSIGDSYGISRERVRQRENNIKKKMINYMTDNNIIQEIKKSALEGYISKEDLDQLVGNKQYIIELLKELEEGVIYSPHLDVYYFKDFEDTLEKIQTIGYKLPREFLLSEIESTLNYQISKHYSGNVDLKKYLEQYGYTVADNYVSKGEISITSMTDIIVRNMDNKVIKLNKETGEYVRRKLKEIFDFDDNVETRSILYRIRERANVALVDTSKIVHWSNIDYNYEIVEKVGEYIETELETKDFIAIDTLYEQFEEDCSHIHLEGVNKKEIEMKVLLYSLIRRHLDRNYTIGKRSTLHIYKKDRELSDIIIEYMRKQNGIASVEELKQEFNLQNITITGFRNQNKQITSWGTDHIRLIESIIITLEDINRMYILIDEEMGEDGATTAKIIYQRFITDKKMIKFMEINKIDNSEKLEEIIKKMLKKYEVSYKVITKPDSKYRNIHEIVYNKLNNNFKASDVQDITEYYGFSDSLAVLFIKNHIESGMIGGTGGKSFVKLV